MLENVNGRINSSTMIMDKHSHLNVSGILNTQSSGFDRPIKAPQEIYPS